MSWRWHATLLAAAVAAAGLLRPAGGSTLYQAAGVTRHADGDTFYLKKDGLPVACSPTLCSDSRAVPFSTHSKDARDKDEPPCSCKCPPESPAFREDLHVCVDDFHECAMASFQSGPRKQKIPFVFLPMKGQIIHPSSDIAFSADVGEDPICVVSSAQFLTRSGWLELRNTSDTEPPLRLFRDQRHTFLQWLGEQDLRFGMEGRILLARLMCKDPNGFLTSPQVDDSPGVITHAFSTPCIAFRVAGSQGAREVMFTSDYTLAGAGGMLHTVMGTETRNSGLSTLEYLAVGLCIMLLCLVYATSVVVYVHVRKIKKKRKRTRRDMGDDSDSERGHAGYARRADMNLVSEGVVKNNPLLMSSATLSNDNFTQRAGLFHNLTKNIRLPRTEQPEQEIRDPDSSGDECQADLGSIPALSSFHTCQGNSSPVSAKSNEVKVQIHPESSSSNEPASSSSGEDNHSSGGSNMGIYTLTLQPSTESGSLERHPGESVSIVETLDEANAKDTRDYSFLGGRHTFNATGMGLPEAEGSCSKACNANVNHTGPLLGSIGGRKKLYFNPAFFEPEMLQEPPPAAVEFLMKLREVVALSKIKIAAKRFSPSLNGIPEESNSIVSSRTSQSVNGYAKQRSWQEQQAASSAVRGCGLPDSFDVCGSKQQTIRRWLEDLENGEPVEDQEDVEPPEVPIAEPAVVVAAETKEDEPPALPTAPMPKKPVRRNSSKSIVKPPQQKRLMDAVIKELVRERGLIGEDIPSSETTTNEEKSLESVPSEVENADNSYEFVAVGSPQGSPPQAVNTHQRPALMMYCLPELLAKTTGYSLVSEVYVNDVYSCSSNQSTSPSSSINRHTIKHRPPKNSVGTPSDQSRSPTSSVSESPDAVNDVENYPGSLTIHLPEAAPHEYKERTDEDDEQFEPDTLDRGRKIHKTRMPEHQNLCTDSLERPTKIQLKSPGTFFTETNNEPTSWTSSVDMWNYSQAKKKRGPSSIADLRSSQISFVSNLSKSSSGTSFGSLREIFEAKRQQQLKQNLEALIAGAADGHQFKNRAARSLIAPNELKMRAHGLDSHTIDEIREMMWSSTPAVESRPKVKPKRQRSADPAACPPVPPPPIPPSLPPKQKKSQPNNKSNFYNPPLPPRETAKNIPPPSLPPKNSRGCRSPAQTRTPHHQQPHQSQTSGQAALLRASADSDEDDEKEGSCTLGRTVEHSINNAFATWKKSRWEQVTSIKMPNRPGDSGYLSSDSNNSLKRVAEELRYQGSETEEDESLCEAGSESGAESIGTDSFFYNKANPQDSVNFGERRRETNIFLPAKKKPPPPPKRVNSKLETKVTKHSHFASNLSSKYGL